MGNTCSDDRKEESNRDNHHLVQQDVPTAADANNDNAFRPGERQLAAMEAYNSMAPTNDDLSNYVPRPEDYIEENGNHLTGLSQAAADTLGKLPKLTLQDTLELKDFSGNPIETVRNIKTNDIYRGQVERKFPMGFGTLVNQNGVAIEGIFKEGKPFSHLTLVLPDGSCFKGDISNWAANGKGTLTKLNGNKISSNNWVNNQIRGQFEEVDHYGKLVYRGAKDEQGNDEGLCQYGHDGFSLQSHYSRGVPTRPPVKVYENGKMYEGLMDEKFLEHGNGTLTLEDGRKLIGNFIRGQPDGKITMVNDSGKSIATTWKDGKRIQ